MTSVTFHIYISGYIRHISQLCQGGSGWQHLFFCTSSPTRLNLSNSTLMVRQSSCSDLSSFQKYLRRQITIFARPLSFPHDLRITFDCSKKELIYKFPKDLLYERNFECWASAKYVTVPLYSSNNQRSSEVTRRFNQNLRLIYVGRTFVCWQNFCCCCRTFGHFRDYPRSTPSQISCPILSVIKQYLGQMSNNRYQFT